jgi:hypothetical protein
MARLESVAVGGFYPTPPHLVPRIARLLTADTSKFSVAIALDPCAGDGAALEALVNALGDPTNVKLYAIEMEKTRHAALATRLRASECFTAEALHGDAFHADIVCDSDSGGASVLYLNPPYDLDRVHGRLEQRFLDRFASKLTAKGVLVFVVPHYALSASAELLAREFEHIQCYRFPDDDFAAYKQVVLYAVRREHPLLQADTSVIEGVRAWAADAATCPVLPYVTDVVSAYSLPLRRHHQAFSTWAMQTLDLGALLTKVRPWVHAARGNTHRHIEAIRPALPPSELMQRVYPIAVPPRPAHIAAGMASGIFNGARVEPDPPPKDAAPKPKTLAPSAPLPALLVKGVFDREYKTIEEKRNKDGDIKGLVQVQQPKMVVTVLDLSTYRYHTLKTGSEATAGPVTVESMTVADLLDNYAGSLMTVMERQCPVLYDPRYDADKVTLAPSPRKLFNAQAHAARACVRLLENDQTPVLLGEIGSGKSSVSIVAARTVGAKRVLILCPPHLLAGWTEQLTAIAPDCDVHILKDVNDLWALRSRSASSVKPFVALLSRETAKLGHGWLSLAPGSTCPGCGGVVPEGDHAKTRARCALSRRRADNEAGVLAYDIARALQPFIPAHANIQALLDGRADQRRGARYHRDQTAGKGKTFQGFDDALVERLALLLVGECNTGEKESVAEAALAKLMLAAYNPARIDRIARMLELPDYSIASSIAVELALLLPPGSPAQVALLADLKAQCKEQTYSYYRPWDAVQERLAELGRNEPLAKHNGYNLEGLVHGLNGPELGESRPRSIVAAVAAFAATLPLCRFKRSAVCDEPLYQAIPEPTYRLPLASVICKHHPRLFDFLILDEGHEYATDGSAQERAAHRLTGLGIPTMLMTGTIMNGYAESLFSNFWAVSRPFRREFARDQRSAFVERYGYRKVLLEEKESKKTITYGSVTDRVEGTRKVIGHAPGVMPLFLLRHLLPVAVTLHKADLAIDLPACTQEPANVKADELVQQQYERLKTALLARIKADAFSEQAGALFGQLSELPSYLDRATLDTGNGHDRAYVIRYPKDTPTVGGHVVATVPLLPASHVLEKERWMLDTVAAELKAGRNVLVFAWHIPVLPRLARLITERIGQKIPVLHADKVPTGKRQDWINKEVIGKKARVMVANPVTVQTGLNNLVHFHTEVWMENPACNPLVFRQAIGRVDRIGQKKATRILVPVYENTMQVQAQDLLMRKVAVSVATDGLDPEAALQAAGVSEDSYLAGLSIGKQLYSMLTDEAGGAPRPPKSTSASQRNPRTVLKTA